jgi:hypothetical protein
MPSMLEINRAEQILAAAREALFAAETSAPSVAQQNSQFASLQQDDFQSRFNQYDSLQRRSSYEPIPLRPGFRPRFNSGLQNQDMSLLLQKQKQSLSMATASQQQQRGWASPMYMSSMQQRQNSLYQQNMVLESLLARQEEERVGFEGERSSLDNSFSPNPQKLPGSLQTQVPLFAKIAQAPPQVKRKRRAKTFPVKLMEAITANYDEDIVSWMPDGRSFVVVNPDLFVDVILKQSFKGCKYTSFVRKLNRWGFSRLTSGADCFYHSLFQRERIDLCAQMLCIPRNESVRKRQARPSARPVVDPSLAMDAYNLSRGDQPSLAGVENFFNSRQGM